MKKTIKSRILEHFKKQLLIDLYDVCKSVKISDNNQKTDMMIEVLNKHGLDYVELGPGTNRFAILIDNYVFKIALDKWGIQDNLNEFTMSDELQPYVIKVYETNELILACEYITVISKEEFIDQKGNLQSILSILAESYLLGDVGTVPRNYLNWGYRDNGDLVILDFAYIYRINGDELLCSACNQFVEYDNNFHDLKCPKCNKKYTFIDLRKKISMEIERNENYIAKQMAYKLTKPLMEVESDSMEEVISNKQKEEINMKKDSYLNENTFDSDEANDKYLEALNSLPLVKSDIRKPVIIRNENILSPIDVIDKRQEESWVEMKKDPDFNMKNYADDFTEKELLLLEYLRVPIDELFFISIEAKDNYLEILRNKLNEEDIIYLDHKKYYNCPDVPEDIIFTDSDGLDKNTILTEEQLEMLKNLKTNLQETVKNIVPHDDNEILNYTIKKPISRVTIDIDILEQSNEKNKEEFQKEIRNMMVEDYGITIEDDIIKNDLKKAYNGRNVEVSVTDETTYQCDNDSLSIGVFNPIEHDSTIPNYHDNENLSISVDEPNGGCEFTSLSVHDLGNGVTVLTDKIESTEENYSDESEEMKKLKEELGLTNND